MILYVSGPMTGYPGFNYAEFDRVSEGLRAAGYAVLNPAENWGGLIGVDRQACMRIDIQQVLMSDGIAYMPGWRASRGARLEIEIAKQVGILTRTVKWWMDSASQR